MSRRKFEFSDAKSHKFWDIEIVGTTVATYYGRIGTDGQSTEKEFSDEEKAETHYEKLITQKTDKGYVEVGRKKASKKTASKKTAAKKTATKKAAKSKVLQEKKKPAAKAVATKKAATKKTKPKVGGRREFHFVSGASAKFWAIELAGDSFDVQYGKIGTDGQKKTKSFASAEKARAACEKLIKEKTGKGYIEVGASGKGDTGSGTYPFSLLGAAEFVGISCSRFAGKRVLRIDNAKDFKAIKNPGKTAFRVGFYWGEEGDPTVLEKFNAVVDSDCAAEIDTLLLGMWGEEHDHSMAGFAKELIKNAKKLPSLKALYFGDIPSEDNEISWIYQTDIGPILKAFPKLEILRVRGGQDLRMTKAKHESLRSLVVETGGMDRTFVMDVCKAKFPNLEYLELWLGTEHYGGNSRINDLQPILKGKLFPKLRQLGLVNCDYADEIAAVVVKSPVLEQLEILDLSMGTLSDSGARALMDLPGDSQLQKLILDHHFMSTKTAKALEQQHEFAVVTTNQQEAMDWGDGEPERYVAVGE